MINRFLPYALIIDGREYAARTDFGVAIDALIALADEDLSYDEKAISVLQIIYPGYREIENITEAIVQAYWFLDGGDFIKSAHSFSASAMSCSICGSSMPEYNTDRFHFVFCSSMSC